MTSESDHATDEPALDVTVQAPDGDPLAEIFTTTAATVIPLMDAVAHQFDCPPATVALVLTRSFMNDVDERLEAAAQRNGHVHRPYTVERVGGIVAAKNINDTDDETSVTILINAELYDDAQPEFTAARLTFLLAHELAHPLLNRLRAASGSPDALPRRSDRAEAIARSIARGALDELRADIIANAVLTALISLTTDGITRPLTIDDIDNAGHLEELAEAFDEHVYPVMPDLVRAYQERKVDLTDMWDQVTATTDQALTLLAHAQAVADVRNTDLFAGTAGDHAAARVYLEPMWTPILNALRDGPLVPSLADFAGTERPVLDAAESAILAMWKSLGLTFDFNEEQGLYIHVNDPRWDS